MPAVVHIIGKGRRCFGNGRQPRAKRRQCYGRRKDLQHATKGRAVRTRQGKERPTMRATNQKRSPPIVSHAPVPGVGIMRMEHLAGIGPRITQRTARTSRGANARKNHRMIAPGTVSHLATVIADKAERAGIAVAWVDPAHPSQRCPACFRLTTADDRPSACAECGWTGHRDAVGAITSSRGNTGTGPHGESAGATVAGFGLARTGDGLPETALVGHHPPER